MYNEIIIHNKNRIGFVMKLLVCDDIKISTYNLPEKIENFFLLNLNILVDDLNLNEVLTLKSYNGLWNIVADEKLVIKSNEVEFKSIVLKEYITFSLKFADFSKFINFYVIPDFSNYISYSLLNVEKVDIGSSINCQIKSANLINIATTIYKNGYDYYIQRTDANLNSSYLNSKIYTNMKLSAGDILFIKGLRIIYMKNFLLIDSFSLPLEIKLVKLEEKNGSFLTPISQVTEIEKSLKLYNENQLFIHTPRLKKEIEFENIELDPPPVKENIQKIPAIFTMGSSAIVTLMSITSLVNSIRNYLNGNGDLFSLLMDLFIFGLMMVMGLFLPMLMEMWEKQRAKKMK